MLRRWLTRAVSTAAVLAAPTFLLAADAPSGDKPAGGGDREALFKKLDANGDGRISRDEFATAYQRWNERRNAPAGAPSGRAASPPSELDELE